MFSLGARGGIGLSRRGGSPRGQPRHGAASAALLTSGRELELGSGLGSVGTGQRAAGTAGLQSLRGATAAPLLTPPLHMSDRTSVRLALSGAFTAYARAFVSFSVDGGADPADTDLLSLLAFSGSKS